MKKYINKFIAFLIVVFLAACADNTLEEEPLDDNYPFRLVMDAAEGADLADAEDYDLEVAFADYLPGQSLPNTPITLSYAITDVEGTMVGNVVIDKIVYEVELDNCVYERELDFTSDGDGLTGTITLAPDTDLKSVPGSFEIIFTLPGADDTEGGFKFELSNLQTSDNLLLGSPNVFEYEVLENDVAGEWELEIGSEEEFEQFKEIFGPLNPELDELAFADITGKVTAEFEFEEMKFVLELAETEEVTVCEDGDTETETVNKIIEIEAEYDAEEGEIEFEGSHEVVNDDGIVEAELDFIMEGEYEVTVDGISINFLSLVDEDNFSEGEELFASEDGITFTFVKD